MTGLTPDIINVETPRHRADLAPDTLYERVRTGAWPGQGVAA